MCFVYALHESKDYTNIVACNYTKIQPTKFNTHLVYAYVHAHTHACMYTYSTSVHAYIHP